MESKGPVQNVLSIDEVLELILEYAASMEEWEWSSKLRLVSKRWRSLSFRSLCQSTQLPKLYIRGSNEYRGDVLPNEINLENFKRIFPRTSSPNITLSQPTLPLELKIQRYPTPHEFTFIQEIVSHIAAVTVAHQSQKRGIPFGVKNVDSQSAPPLQLPNLRSLFVSWENAPSDPLFKEIVDLIKNSSKRLLYLKYQYPSGHYSESWPKPPSNLTHLSYTGNFLHLEKLLNGTVQTLSGLEFIMPKINIRNRDVTFDCNLLSGILQRHWKTLRNLTINTLYGEVTLRGAIEVNHVETVKILDTEFPLLFKDNKNMADTKPKLRYVNYTIGHHPGNVSAALDLLKLSTSSLEFLALHWFKYQPSSFLEPNYIASGRECEQRFASELEQCVPLCSKLTELKILKFPFSVGIALMRRVYESMTNLLSLTLHFDTSTGETRSSSRENTEFCRILTGCDPEDIPSDELIWPNYLVHRNQHSITRLKHLESLRLEASDRARCVLGRFIFMAGFMQMSKLRNIDVQGGILVDKDMIRIWTESGGRFTSWR